MFKREEASYFDIRIENFFSMEHDPNFFAFVVLIQSLWTELFEKLSKNLSVSCLLSFIAIDCVHKNSERDPKKSSECNRLFMVFQHCNRKKESQHYREECSIYIIVYLCVA